jgi:leucyl aminopeptidase
MQIKINTYREIKVAAALCISDAIIGPSLTKIVPESIAKAILRKASEWQKIRSFSDGGRSYISIAPFSGKGDRAEHFRQMGALLFNELRNANQDHVEIAGASGDDVLHLTEGIILKSYSFDIHKSKPNGYTLSGVSLPAVLVSEAQIKELRARLAGIFWARNLVNEPANILTASELAERIARDGKEAGYDVEILRKAKLRTLKMGGILSVNKGSTEEPTLSILTYKHPKAKNKKPLILVGKGVVYDTGGLSLKPTPNSMDIMKCDMAGAAAVAGAISAIARAGIKANVIGIIPATDNRIGPDAYSPGDVITMYDGTRVEVMNTDAEGRLLLADALAYAKKYNPELVIDLATLTGSSMHTVSHFGAAAMSTAGDDIINNLLASGQATYERVVMLPLWDEYAADLESDIADIKNLGSDPLGGAVKAGKFLERFTDYPWIHLDIAGPAFIPSARGYLPKGATGYGVSLLYQFIKDRSI